MGTRSAPLVFLLLAACMTTDGTRTAVGDRGGPAQDPAAHTAAAPVTLPAVPRMRPKAPPKQQTSRTPQAPPGGVVAKAGKASAGVASAAAPPPNHAADSSGEAATAATAPAAEAAAPPGADAAADRNLPSLADAATGAAGDPAVAMAELEAPPATGDRPAIPGDDTYTPDAFAGDGGFDLQDDVAALTLPERNPGIDVESLFDGDVVRYCAAMWQMGEYIGTARRRGEPFKRAIDDSVRRIAVEKQLPLDNRLAFSGQVYGRLVYRLEDSHAALTLGTYVHFACLTVRGDKKIVPADPNAERLLNAGLMHCETTSFTRDDLNDCIFRELTPIVDRRND